MNGANGSANFSSTAQTYTISGTINGAGGVNATVKLTGAATATVTASATGVYTFQGSLTAPTPSRQARVAMRSTPASQNVTVNGANASANFSSTVQTYAISGTISGAGGANATVKLTGAATRNRHRECYWGLYVPRARKRILYRHAQQDRIYFLARQPKCHGEWRQRLCEFQFRYSNLHD